MIWAKRVFDGTVYVPYQDLMQQLLFANAEHHQEFILVATDTGRPGVSTSWVGVPSEMLLAPFDRFERVQEADLPKEIDTLLVADTTNERFKSRFKFRSPRT